MHKVAAELLWTQQPVSINLCWCLTNQNISIHLAIVLRLQPNPNVPAFARTILYSPPVFLHALFHFQIAFLDSNPVIMISKGL